MFLGINLANSLVKNLGNLRKVYGSIDLNNRITSLNNLEYLGSNLFLGKTKLVDLGNLQTIDGTLNIEKSNLKSLGCLRKVGTLQIYSQTMRDFGEIEEIKKIEVNSTNSSTIKLIKKEFKVVNNNYVRIYSKIKQQDIQ